MLASCMRSIALLLTTTISLAGQAAWGADGKADDRPNIVFVLVDDLRFNGLGCTGHPYAKTPHVDRLAKEGANFRNAFVTLPLCSPGRACFLTGRYSHANGVIDNRDHNELSHTLVTFPRLLHDAGYQTAYVGKWHMGNDDSPRPGFDRWVSFKGQGQYENPPLNIDGKAVKADGYITDLLTDHAVEFLKQPREKPFVLYLAHKAIHGPFTPAERHKDLYAGQMLEPRPNVADTLEGKPALTRKLDVAPPAGGKGKGKAANKNQGAGAKPHAHDDLARNQLRCLAAIDDGVGRILKTLEETGQLDKTMIIFTSDNGYLWGEHGLGDKRAAYEESIRIPLVIRYPKLIKPQSTPAELTLNIDIAPTLLELAGVGTPPNVHGRSLLGLLRGESTGWRDRFLAEYFYEAGFPRIPAWQAVRTGQWKLIHYTDLEGMDELYDLETDPYELKNLIQDSAAHSMAEQLRADMKRLLAETAQ